MNETDELEKELDKYKIILTDKQKRELEELLYFMNEHQLWEEETLSFESIIKASQCIMFIKDQIKPHNYKM